MHRQAFRQSEVRGVSCRIPNGCVQRLALSGHRQGVDSTSFAFSQQCVRLSPGTHRVETTIVHSAVCAPRFSGER